ncbi:hypothetical protein RclHR1_04800002 [Rhizophagus clarus]|uniref:Protein kinase domain-containing protein n=2 Tax=Rhizophagus clarus TaxID=94130 RepID=A0A2Z6S1Z4_9GLOM|nr:hypothetical protein RclHR1_04800002 [Rhizophagus clarus]
MSFQNSVDYLEYLKNNLKNRISGNEEIDDFVQNMQLKIKHYDDIVFEWIPYNQFHEIKETGRNEFTTNYSVMWRNGPLYWDEQNNKYARASNKKVALKRFHNLRNPIKFLIKETEKYSINRYGHKFNEIYGISQNPVTNDYILVLNNSINLVKWTSGNKKIDDFIQKMRLRLNKRDGIILEWIPYDQFNEIREIGKYDFKTTYSAIWKNGPLYYIDQYNIYARDLNKKISLKCLYNSQDDIDKVLFEAEIYSELFKIYGISQDPYTSNFILVLNWTSGNERIDDFIQEIQLSTSEYGEMIFEWIPYTQFVKIKETGKNESMIAYSAIWKDGPLYYKHYQNIYSNREVTLKCLHNSQDPIEFVINEAKKYMSNRKIFEPCGISQNPYTNNFILVQNNITWISGNERIDDFIQEIQLNTEEIDMIFEWIPYTRFDKIKETGKNESMIVYSTIWKDGPLYYNYYQDNTRRYSNIKVTLKCLHNSQNHIEFVINEAKKYLSNRKIFKPYGISQNPYTNDFIIVQNNITWISGNEKIDDFIQEIQLNTKLNDIIFEWIPYTQFDKIKETGKNESMIAYSAIWKDGPLYFVNTRRYSNKEVTLKCLHNSRDPIEFVINEAKKYLSNRKIFEPCGISQNPYTNDFILVQNNITWISGNERIDDFIQEIQLNTKFDDTIFEWIPYDQFVKIEEIGRGGFATIYSAIWKNGPLKEQNGNYKRNSNKNIALKCLDNLQRPTDELLNEVKAYSTGMIDNSNILKIYGISQNPNTKDYIIVLHYMEGGNFNNWIYVNENFKYFSWKKKIRTLYFIARGLKEIHKKKMAHHDFHTGNILFDSPLMEQYVNRTYISDMGLCRRIGENNQNNIYGVMPYVAPEVLRGRPYTQASDIYSFGMMMYFVATGRQPFDNCAHDHILALDICKGTRPELKEQEAPKSYINLMRKCWNSNPHNRPNVTKLYQSLWSININDSEIERAENYRNLHLTSLMESRQTATHPQAIYTSRLLNPFTKDLQNSECLDCAILD